MPYNMAYCRFENTLGALRECAEALNENDPFPGLSLPERRAAEKLIKLCRKIASDFEHVGT